MKNLRDYGLTDMLVVVCLVKFAISQNPSWIDVAALFVAMLGLMHKRYETNKHIVFRDQIDAMAHEIKFIRDRQDEFERATKDTQTRIERSAEDIKKVISTANLSSALYTRVRKRDA